MGVRKRALLISATVVIVAAGAITVTVLSRSNSPIGPPIQVSFADIVRIGTEPFPRERSRPPFAQAPANAPSYPLDLIRDLIPIPLPALLKQGDCRTGVTLIIELRDGRVIRYGPCRRPASIEQLIQGMLNEASTLPGKP
jgi:hypothetical protein